MRGFRSPSGNLWFKGNAWWRTQSHANRSPPSNSLLSGKTTGNFLKSRLGDPYPTSYSDEDSKICRRFPCFTEQGIFKTVTANLQQQIREIRAQRSVHFSHACSRC